MKNPYGVEPTRFMKRKESKYAIYCYRYNGPTFANSCADILIGDNCNRENYCGIYNNGTQAYECHPRYKCSLFVNTAGSNGLNKFTLLDYEVFAYY